MNSINVLLSPWLVNSIYLAGSGGLSKMLCALLGGAIFGGAAIARCGIMGEWNNRDRNLSS